MQNSARPIRTKISRVRLIRQIGTSPTDPSFVANVRCTDRLPCHGLKVQMSVTSAQSPALAKAAAEIQIAALDSCLRGSDQPRNRDLTRHYEPGVASASAKLCPRVIVS